MAQEPAPAALRHDTTVLRLGSTCSILVGISYVVFGIATLLDPTRTSSTFWQTLVQAPTWFLISRWAVTVGALLALAVVPAVARVLDSPHAAWVAWLSKIAELGFFVTALSSVQAFSVDVLYANIDPQSWLTIGCVGLWVFGINILALQIGAWPKLLSYVGLVVAGMYGVALTGNALGIPVLFTIAAGLGGVVLGPIWYIWLGLKLRQVNTDRGQAQASDEQE
jgi:hypothetical protein